jgi:hypothetical protein
MLRTPKCCAVVFAALAVACAAPALAAADSPDPTTLAPTEVSSTTATFHGTVDPGGLPTVAHFEYGTSEDLLQSTPDVPIPAGTTAVPVTAPVGGLLSNRKYYVALYVSNADDAGYGDTIPFMTLHAPNIIQQGETDIAQFSATLHVKVMGYGQPVTLTTTVASPTGVAPPVAAAPVTVPADGIAAIAVSGLQPSTTYRWTTVGTSAGGQDTTWATFRTAPLIPMPRPAASVTLASYGSSVTIGGTIPGAAALPIALQQQPFPYTIPFAPAALPAGATDAAGAYSFTVQALQRMRYGVSSAAYALPDRGNTVELRVVPVVTAHQTRARRGRFVVSGGYAPNVPARVSLWWQGHGYLAPVPVVRRAGPHDRTFRFPARKLRPGVYRVRVAPAVATGFDSGYSTTFRISRRR